MNAEKIFNEEIAPIETEISPEAEWILEEQESKNVEDVGADDETPKPTEEIEQVIIPDDQPIGRVKPTMEEMFRYAKPIIYKTIGKYSPEMPEEQKEETEQNAYLRLIEAYPKVDPNAGWKSFVYNHSRGSVLDYLKSGEGFQEDSWSLKKEEKHGAVHVNKMKHRLQIVSEDGDDVETEAILGMNGKFTEMQLDYPNLKWDLLARMASHDRELHAFLKWLRGQRLEEIGRVIGVSRASVGQMIIGFVNRFDDPSFATELGKKFWFDQIIWCLGLHRMFGLEDRDQSEVCGHPLGQTLDPVDLDNAKPKFVYDNEMQGDLFTLLN